VSVLLTDLALFAGGSRREPGRWRILPTQTAVAVAGRGRRSRREPSRQTVPGGVSV
jgi:hypothetical protein